MTIEFPNQSRSYDANHHQIRFWGHDASREVTFLVEAEALHQVGARTTTDEDTLLQAFDTNRGRIEIAARKAYSRHGNGFYVLGLSDL
jgi:hypothetical protein